MRHPFHAPAFSGSVYPANETQACFPIVALGLPAGLVLQLYPFLLPAALRFKRPGVFSPTAWRGWLSFGAPHNHVERVVAHLQTLALERFPNIFEILSRGQRPFYSGEKRANKRDSSLRGIGGESLQTTAVPFLRGHGALYCCTYSTMRTRCKVSKVRKIHGNEQKLTIVNICSREITLLHRESTVVITVQHFLEALGVTWADHRRKTCVLEHKGSGTTLWCFPVLTAHLSYTLSGTTVNRFWYRCGTTLERDIL